MDEKPVKKERARLSILYHLAQFALAKKHGSSQFGASDDWCFNYTTIAKPGDLVSLQSAPLNKWYLSWLVERSWPEGHSCEQFTLESIEDGQLCNWSNVSLLVFSRETVEEHPEWRWTDEQYEFNDRWIRACYKKRDAYMKLPIQASFNGQSVELAIRWRMGFGPERPNKWFPNWRKVTIKQMLNFYDWAVAEMEKPRQLSPAGH